VSLKRPNQALKLTRRAACSLGCRASAHNLPVPYSCTSPAVQLNAGVRRLRADCSEVRK